MSKTLAFVFLALEVMLLFSACSAALPEDMSSDEEEPQIQKEISETKEREEIFFTSIVTDETTEEPYIEKTDEVFLPVLIKPEEVKMSEDKQEIYDKYIAPIGNRMPLRTEFSEESAPEGIYTYIFQQCAGLDKEVLGINKDYATEVAEGDGFWVEGRYAEETIDRWFGWEPEDYREYFEYDAEKDMYLIVACGGGPSFYYITDYKQEGDILSVSYSAYYDGTMDSDSPEMDFFYVYYKGIIEIKLEEKGWKYISNKEVYSEEFPYWYNTDFSFNASSLDYEYLVKEEFKITKGNEVSKLVIFGPMQREFYMSDFPIGIFITAGGIHVYDFEKEHIRTITQLPTKYDKEHSVITAFMDGNNNIIVAYVKDDYNPFASPIEIAVLDYSSLSVINYIDTGTNPQKTYSIRLEEDGKIVIKYPDFNRTEIIRYLEEPLNPVDMITVSKTPEIQEEENSLPEKAEEQVSYPDEETEWLMEIYKTSENYIDEIVGAGYAYYSTEKAYGYDNILAFADDFPDNSDEIFYIAEFGTYWKIYRIGFSEGGWIFTDCADKMKEYPISEVKIYDDRVTFYFETGGKKVFYEKGSEPGATWNNCSHPEQAHFIDIEIIRYINSDEFKAKYEETHSENHISVDDYFENCYDEEEKCLLNIYDIIEYYGLTYDDFIAAYGSEERIAEIWLDADIKGYFEK